MGSFLSSESARYIDKQRHSGQPLPQNAQRQPVSGILRVVVVTSVVDESELPYRYKGNIKTGQYAADGTDASVYATGVDLFSKDKLAVDDIVHAAFSHGNHWEAMGFTNRIGYCWILSGTSGVEMDGVDKLNQFYKLYKYPCKISTFLEQYSPSQDSFIVSNRMIEAFKDTPVKATWNGDFWVADGFFSIPIAYAATMRGRLRKVSMSQASHSFSSDIDTGSVQAAMSSSGYRSQDNLSSIHPMPNFQGSGLVSLSMRAVDVSFGIGYGGGLSNYECSISELLDGVTKSSMFLDRDSTLANSAFSIYNRSISVSSIRPT